MTASAQLPPMRGGIAGATEAAAYGGSRAAPPYPQVSSATVFRRFHVQRWPGCVSSENGKPSGLGKTAAHGEHMDEEQSGDVHW